MNEGGTLVAVGSVTSVAGKTGAVTLVKADITDFSDSDYATGAEGDLAATATQPGDNVSTLINDAGYLTSAPSGATVSETPPLTPSEGDLWYDSSDTGGRTYVYYTDADSSQWVDVAPQGAGGSVYSVAGKEGAVTLVKADITDFSDGDYATAAQGTLADGAVQSTGDTMTGALGMPAGSAASPSVYFDANTGIYSPGADQVAISTNGTGRLFVDASGNVGVGVAAPNANNKLDVAGNLLLSGSDNSIHLTNGTGVSDSGNGAIRVRGQSGASPSMILGVPSSGYWAFEQNGSEKARIDSSGRLGLGTSSPSYKLEVRADSAGVPVGINMVDTNASGRSYSIRSDAGQLRFRDVTGSADRVVLDSSGRVGIGTDLPRSLLSLGAAPATSTATPATLDLGGTYSSTAGANPKLRIFYDGSSTAGFGLSANQLDYISIAGNAHAFYVGTSQVMKIDGSGRLLVGTSSYSGNATLVLENNSSGSSFGHLRINTNTSSPANGNALGLITFSDNTTSYSADIYAARDGGTWSASSKPTRLVFSTTADGASSPTERMRIRQNGFTSIRSVGVGAVISLLTSLSANSSDTLLDGFHSSTDINSGTASIRIRTNGNIENSNNSYGQLSDIKLKENIVDANSQWDDIKALQVRNFNFKEGQTHTQIGLIAQEVELVSPGLVNEAPDRDEDGNDLGTVTKSVSYSVLYMKAVKALQEAMERIETLEAEVAALKAS